MNVKHKLQKKVETKLSKYVVIIDGARLKWVDKATNKRVLEIKKNKIKFVDGIRKRQDRLIRQWIEHT